MLVLSENIQQRYEQKFIFVQERPSIVEKIVKTHPANFHEVFNQRKVNNIYLDKPGLQYYTDHKNENANRKKVRIRWYGDTYGYIVRPVLEFKIREDELRIKKSYPLPIFSIEKGFQSEKLREIFAHADLPESVREDIEDLEAHLLNSYYRSYYRSFDSHFRFTIDQNLSYCKFLQQQNLSKRKKIDNNNVILELKFETKYAKEAPSINSKLPVNGSSDFSKYVSGIDMFYPK